MRHLHFTNAFFEEELETISTSTIEEYIQNHPLYIQLQFLAFLYAKPQDEVLLSHRPEPDYFDRLSQLGIAIKPYHLLHESMSDDLSLHSWGHSNCLQNWARAHHVVYDMPSWDIVQKVNSKEFSFSESPPLPGAALIHNEEEALSWWQTMTGPKVFKSVYGVSGRGHHIAARPDQSFSKALPFLQKQWNRSLPVLAEPWVSRVLDFSTQWEILRDGTYVYIGSTICENNARGMYVRNLVGPDKAIFKEHVVYLKQHLQIAEKTIQKLSSLGYFGNVGFDAMVYQTGEYASSFTLHPIVEINARKTMGWVALQLLSLLKEDSILSLSYQSFDERKNLLPHFALTRSGEKITFEKKLVMQTIPS
jgi:hypothetical protein